MNIHNACMYSVGPRGAKPLEYFFCLSIAGNYMSIITLVDAVSSLPRELLVSGTYGYVKYWSFGSREQ